MPRGIAKNVFYYEEAVITYEKALTEAKKAGCTSCVNYIR